MFKNHKVLIFISILALTVFVSCDSQNTKVTQAESTNVTTSQVSSSPTQTCDPSYPGVCIPPYPPDLDCGQIRFKNFKVVGSDRHGFDRDQDGIGCEPYDVIQPSEEPAPGNDVSTNDDYISTTNTLLKFDSEWKALTTFSDDGTPYAYFSGLILEVFNLDHVRKKLNVIKFDLAMINVPDDLKPIKNGLSEIYEIEINAFDTGEWNANVTPSNVVEVISVIQANPGPIGGLYDKRWTEAQLMRKKLYEYWITEMADKGLAREFVEEFANDLDEFGAITNFGK